MLRIKFALIAIGAATVASAGVTGPQGIWLLTDGDSQTDAMIQGSSVQTFSQSSKSTLQYAVAWQPNYLGGTFTTVGRDVGGVGGVYDLTHTELDTFTNFSTIEGEHLDGTRDSLLDITYAANFTTGDVVKYGDGLFNGPTVSLYNAGAFSLWSITYHAGRNSLFLGQNGLITEIDMAGNVLGSFNTPDGTVRSLAYDGTDDTMWYLTSDGNQIVQIDGVGSELGRATVNLGGNYWGGEIAPVPEPATIVAVGLGLAALLLRRKK